MKLQFAGIAVKENQASSSYKQTRTKDKRSFLTGNLQTYQIAQQEYRKFPPTQSMASLIYSSTKVWFELAATQKSDTPCPTILEQVPFPLILRLHTVLNVLELGDPLHPKQLTFVHGINDAVH